MNVVPLLGLKFTRSNGQPLRLQSNTNQPVALVRLVETSAVPAKKGRFLEGQIDTTFNKGQELFFGPRVCMLKELGLSCPEYLLTVQPNGKATPKNVVSCPGFLYFKGGRAPTTINSLRCNLL